MKTRPNDPRVTGDTTSLEDHRARLGRILVECPKCKVPSELEKERKGLKTPLCGNCGEKLPVETKPEKGEK